MRAIQPHFTAAVQIGPPSRPACPCGDSRDLRLQVSRCFLHARFDRGPELRISAKVIAAAHRFLSAMHHFSLPMNPFIAHTSPCAVAPNTIMTCIASMQCCIATTNPGPAWRLRGMASMGYYHSFHGGHETRPDRWRLIRGSSTVLAGSARTLRSDGFLQESGIGATASDRSA
jgi:hypothetical protein